MTIEFQKNILSYLFTTKSRYVEYLTTDLFDTQELKALFELYMSYLSKYKEIPSEGNFIEHFSSNPTLTEDSKDFLRNSMVWLYEPVQDVVLIKETLLTEVKKKMFRNAMIASMNAMESGQEIEEAAKLYSQMNKIINLDDGNENAGTFLLQDLNKVTFTRADVYPSFLQGLNRLTSLGGFHPPQSIVWLAPPKSFKTGLLIKFGKEYMYDGLDVFHADFENGEGEVVERYKQAMLECRIDQLFEKADTLRQIKQKLKMLESGEIFVKRYRKRKDHCAHIEEDLERWVEKGGNPKFLIVDYVDIMGDPQKGRDNRREAIQENYAGVDNLNNKFGMFSMTVSKIKQAAVGKDKYEGTDVAEDYEKVYNAHAVFGLHRTEEDGKMNIASITPVVQRKGQNWGRVNLKLDAINFVMEEL